MPISLSYCGCLVFKGESFSAVLINFVTYYLLNKLKNLALLRQISLIYDQKSLAQNNKQPKVSQLLHYEPTKTNK